MLTSINNNPFRTLGVSSNSRQADIVRNIGKIKAYLNVGRAVEFPMDLQGLLTNLNRTIESIQASQAAINLPNDKIRHALFWFCNAELIDEAGLSNLASDDLGMTKLIFEGIETFSSLVNRAVVAMMQSNYSRKDDEVHDETSYFKTKKEITIH